MTKESSNHSTEECAKIQAAKIESAQAPQIEGVQNQSQSATLAKQALMDLKWQIQKAAAADAQLVANTSANSEQPNCQHVPVTAAVIHVSVESDSKLARLQAYTDSGLSEEVLFICVVVVPT